MVTRDRQTADTTLDPCDGFRYMSSNDSVQCLFSSPFTSLSMGRRPWATPEQLKFLHSHTHELPQAKAGTGLNVLYARVAKDFLVHWEAEPYSTHKAPTATASELEDLAKAQLNDVRFTLVCVYSTVDGRQQRVTNWYKRFLKGSGDGRSPGPYKKPHALDLTGRSARKKPPYQLHQAFSVLHWRPKDSPLRREVNDLWAKRQDDEACRFLSPFIKKSRSIISLTRLQFHMVVMEWKCSMLHLNELATLRSWIDEQRALNERPWAEEAKVYGDDLVAENRHIQRLIFIFYLLRTRC